MPYRSEEGNTILVNPYTAFKTIRFPESATQQILLHSQSLKLYLSDTTKKKLLKTRDEYNKKE
jgi:hypothetical protein